MTNDEIISMAGQAGISFQSHIGIAGREHVTTTGSQPISKIAKLIELAKAAEREACAKVCEDKVARCDEEAERAIEGGESDEVSAIRSTAWQISSCANLIRARGNQPPKGGA